MVKQKKGWIKLVEVFVSILLITGLVLIMLNEGRVQLQDNTETIYEREIYILREIQINDTFREEIVNLNAPVEWDDFPTGIKTAMENRFPDYLECEAKICTLDDYCDLTDSPEDSVYVQQVAIFCGMNTYNLMKLKLFCWEI